MSVLIWVQTACNDYQETAKVAASKKRVNDTCIWKFICYRKKLLNILEAGIDPPVLIFMLQEEVIEYLRSGY